MNIHLSPPPLHFEFNLRRKGILMRKFHLKSFKRWTFLSSFLTAIFISDEKFPYFLINTTSVGSNLALRRMTFTINYAPRRAFNSLWGGGTSDPITLLCLLNKGTSEGWINESNVAFCVFKVISIRFLFSSRSFLYFKKLQLDEKRSSSGRNELHFGSLICANNCLLLIFLSLRDVKFVCGREIIPR